MALFSCYSMWFSSLPDDAVVLTPNHRLARFIQQQYGLFQAEKGAKGWEKLDCLSFDHWLGRQYQDALQARPSLSPQQQSALWQRIVEQADLNAYASESLADWLASAVARCGDWQLDIETLPLEGEEAQLLQRCFKAYTDACSQKDLTDKAGVLQAVLGAIKTQKLPIAQSIFLLGFDDLTPAQNALLVALEKAGASVQQQALQIDSATHRLPVTDQSTEITLAARWALNIIAAEPGKTVGVVIPNLAAVRSQVVREFHRLAEPGYIWPDLEQHASGFNISAGQPLAHMPMIKTSLDLLALNRHRMSVDDLAVLASPFIAEADQQQDTRFRLLADIRQYHVDITPRQLLSRTAKAEQDAALNDALHRFYERINALSGVQKSFSKWAEIFPQLLAAFGWPGQRALDSLEYQQLKQWRAALDEFTRLDLVLPPADFQTALALFAQHLYVPFLPQTANSPLQVLGMLEAAGMHFDYLWVMGLNDNVWPEPCQPNPLLPGALQKQLQMPRASVERELTLAQRLTRRLSQSAAQVIFSHALWNNDEPLRPSVLIADIPEITAKELGLGSGDDVQVQAAPLESLADFSGIPLPSGRRTVKGGSALLKDQSACPFRAYARFRLNAQNSDEQVKGVSPLLRGNLLHNVMERLWAELKNQKILLEQTPDEINAVLEESLEQAWLEAKAWHIGPKGKLLELSRARQMVLAWLDVERNRSAFSVAQYEAEGTGAIGPLTVKLRIDRIDELGDGRKVVMDYKTGKTNPNVWLGERPDEPQVPLYSLLTSNLAAAAFAELSIYETALKGVAADEAVAPGLKSVESFTKKMEEVKNWETLLNHWRSTLERLAIDYAQGKAGVDPKTPSVTCRYCDLHSFCRIGLYAEQDSDAMPASTAQKAQRQKEDRYDQ